MLPVIASEAHPTKSMILWGPRVPSRIYDSAGWKKRDNVSDCGACSERKRGTSSEFASATPRNGFAPGNDKQGIALKVIPADSVFQSYLDMLAPSFRGKKTDVTEENIQARIRGNILMALSNKFGWLLLTTGNKSETAVGYCTLYGDMAGGFAVIKDVPKTLVYQLAKYRNSLQAKEIIPTSVLEKEPSAELAPNQRDTDTLPPYEILDPILQAYVEEDKSSSQIVAMGFDAKVVHKVIRMVDRNEYKRRQAAPGVKITHRAFGKDRRLPITNHYKELQI